MRKIIQIVFSLRLALFTIFFVGVITSSVAASSEIKQEPPGKIDPAVWQVLQSSEDRQAIYSVEMQEIPGTGPESTVNAQGQLVDVLKILKQKGTISDFKPYYGENIILIKGGAVSLRFVSSWFEVDRILPVRIDSALDEEKIQGQNPSLTDANGVVTGVVYGPDGISPLPGIRVILYHQTGPVSWEISSIVFTGSDGTYLASGLQTGIYRVHFQDQTGNYVSEFYNNQSDFIFATNFSVTDGQTTSGINASLAQAGGISGTLTAVNGGSPLADIVVSAWKSEGGTWKNRGSAVSASDGSYRVGGLLPGTYRVRFSDSNPIPRYIDEFFNNVSTIGNATDVNVVAGSTTTGINASLGSYGRITGRVTAQDGITPISSITVDIYVWESGSSSWNLQYSLDTDENGDYISDGIDTLDYRIGFVDISGMYADEFYNNKPDLNSANTINGILGETVSGIDASLTRQVMMTNKVLGTGWNLVNLALTEGGEAPETVLDSIAGNYSVAYAWDNCGSGEWLSYNPDDPLSDLETIDPSMGVWLDMTSTDTISLDGLHPITTTITLCTGWNLIGYPSVVSRPIKDVLGDISGKYDIVYAYDASNLTNPWRTFNPNIPVGNSLTKMEPWTGYWILMNQNAELEIPGH